MYPTDGNRQHCYSGDFGAVHFTRLWFFDADENHPTGAELIHSLTVASYQPYPTKDHIT